MDSKILETILHNSINDFFRFEHEEIKNGVNERALCGSLGAYIAKWALEYKVDGYHIDTNYDRKQGGKIKTILNQTNKIVKIEVDLIFLSRGKKKIDNLIAIEMKKSYRKDEDKQSNQERLMIKTKKTYDGIWSADGETYPEHVCGYLIGCYIELDIKKMDYIIKIYQNGTMVKDYQGNIIDS